jgi:hypothetical protein
VRSNARPIIVVVDVVVAICLFFIGKTIGNPTIPYPLNKKYFYSQFPLVFPLDFPLKSNKYKNILNNSGNYRKNPAEN